MENLKIEDLVEGEIYIGTWDYDQKCVFKHKLCGIDAINTLKYAKEWCTGFNIQIRKSTIEEQHWLNCCIEKNEFVPYEKAMETFNSETFAIEINSQKELNVCMEYYKNLGYKETGASHNYDKSFNWVKIDTKCKTWQTVFKHNINGLLVKTLKELSINQQNTQQYEVGRWYEYNPERNYAKLESFDIKNNKFYFSDRIFSNGEYADKKECIKKYQNNYWDLAKFNTNYLTDLKVIQQYLPEGHVDKQKPKQSLYEYEVVHCQTKEEWNFVREKTTKVNSQEWEKAIGQYSEGIALVSNGSSWCGLNYFKQFNTLILSFNEWCNKFGHSPDFMNKKQEIIPEYYQYIGKGSSNFTPNKIYKCVNPNNLEDGCNFISDNGSGDGWCGGNYKYFIPSTKEAYETQFKVYPLTPEECFSSETIEIGDDIQYTDGYVYTIVSENPTMLYWHSNQQTTKYHLSIEEIRKESNWKLISKAKNNTTHVNKKVDISSPVQVGNEVTNITIPKSASVVLKNTENEVKIKINLKQTIKI